MVLNLGLKSIRAIIFDDDFNIISSSAKPLRTWIDNSAVEQCPNEWWSKAIEVINESINKLNRSENIHSFTVTASSCCVIPVDENGLPLSKVIMVSDKRANQENKRILDSPVYKYLIKKGLIIPTNPTLMLPKILWIKGHLPEIETSTKFYLSPNDYFINRLVGVAVTDTLNAEKNVFDTSKAKYAHELLYDLGVDKNKLPEVVEPGTIIGRINNPELPSKLIGASVVVSTYDAICSFIGAGPSKLGDGCDVSGTVTSLRVLSKYKNLIINGGNVFVQNEKSMGISACGASNNLGGGIIEWCKQVFYGSKEGSYGLMENEVLSIPSEINAPIFLPYLMGERAPLWNDNARGVFFGLSRHHNRAYMTRSVFESAAFSLKQLSDEVEAITRVGSISVSGGLARLNIINQMKADVLNKEIKVLSEFETTAIGAYTYLLKAQNNKINLEDVKANTKIRQIIIPDKANHEMYMPRYELFKSIYSSLVPNFNTLASFEKSSFFQSKETVENM